MTTVVSPRLGLPETGEDARNPLARAILGPLDQAAWVRPAFLGVTLLAAVVYLWGLTVSGYANTYYSAAALAASQSWSAWFFGSFDAANFITVDKPPLGTMIMGLSVRLFGLSSWSILLPQALAGVATVALLFWTVRRQFGPVAATIAGVVMALTPVAVLIFRYNNPDAILTLLLVAGAAALVRALETGRLRWVILAAAFVGLGFDAKYLQAYLVLPAFALTYALAAPGGVRRRIAGLVVAALTVLVTSLWWVVIVELIPTDLRPYIGGSTTDSAVQLLLGYDGLGRIFGSGAGPGGGGASFSGAVGILRLFNAEFGGQIAWFVPFALIALASGLWIRRRSRRTDAGLAGYLLWGGWFATHAIVFSFMSGIVHTYYAVALAPAVAALVGAGAVDLWRLRERSRFGGLLLAGAVVITAWLAYELLDRTPDFLPGLGIGLLVVGISAAVVLALPMAAAGRRPSLAAGCARSGRPAGRSRGLRRRHDRVGARWRRPVGWSGGRRRAGRPRVRRWRGLHPARQRPGRHRTGRRRPGCVRRRVRGRRVGRPGRDRLPRRQSRRGDLDRRHPRLGQRRLDRARDRPAGHGHGWLHGLGPHPDARRAPGLHRVRPAPVRHPERRRQWRAGW